MPSVPPGPPYTSRVLFKETGMLDRRCSYVNTADREPVVERPRKVSQDQQLRKDMPSSSTIDKKYI